VRTQLGQHPARDLGVYERARERTGVERTHDLAAQLEARRVRQQQQVVRRQCGGHRGRDIVGIQVQERARAVVAE
jgi:hypothetical protein